MIRVFIPEIKGRVKTSVRGFWQDNGKVYYDYLRVEQEDFNLNNPYARFNFYNHLEDFKRFYMRQ